MIAYHFSARNHEGQLVRAEVEAENVKAATLLLRERGLFPISITQKDEAERTPLALLDHLRRRIPAKEKVLFSRQLATLINSGLPISQSLAALLEQTQNKTFRGVIADIHQSVEGGSSLAAALKRHPDHFSPVYVSLVEAGEQSGTLDKTLLRLATQQEKDQQVNSKIRSAMIYPLIVLLVIIGVLVLMLVRVVPQVTSVYDDLNKPVPAITQMLLALSSFITHFWWLVLLAFAGGAWWLRHYARTPVGRHTFDRLKLRAPLVSALARKMYMARFTRTMGTLVGSGVPLLDALAIVKGAVNNSVVEVEIVKAANEVRGGAALSTPLSESPEFPILVSQMVRIGEQTGNLDEMMTKLAVYFEDEVDEMVKNLSTLIEPIMMIVLGVLVGGMIAAVLGPIYGLIGQIQ
jgi:type IV pilus assembly protein PilC